MGADIDTVNHIREFNRFYTNILGLLNQHILNSDFSLTEARILYDMNEKDCCTANELSEKLDIDKSYMSRIIRKFEKKRLISKNVSDDDSRAFIIELTKQGHDTINQLIDESNQQIERLLDSLNGKECKEICVAMDTVKKYFTKATVKSEE